MPPHNPLLLRFGLPLVILTLTSPVPSAVADTPGVVVYRFEQTLMVIAKEKDRVEPVLQFFAKLKDSATKMEAIGLVDDRIVRLVPEDAASKVLGNLLKDADPKVRIRAAHALGS
jgi:hypothetical protein